MRLKITLLTWKNYAEMFVCVVFKSRFIDKSLITILAGVLHIFMFLLNVSLEIWGLCCGEIAKATCNPQSQVFDFHMFF